MKPIPMWTALAAIAASLTLAPHDAAAQQTVRLDGSSTVFPISEAVAEEFQIAHRGKVRVTVGISGTGGGFKKFCRGEIDIADASRPISKSEMDACARAGIQYIELPVAYDALTVAVNPKNTWVDTLTVAELKKMWEPAAQGRITTWQQVNPKWPAQPLALFGPGADSGTFDYFTEAIVGKSKSSRGDFTASEDDNVLVQGVESDVNALGYFGYAYYAPNAAKMKAVKIVNSKGRAVGPSPQGVLDGSYEPLSRPIFIYVNKASAQREEVKAFVAFYLTKGPPLVEEVKYVPLAKNAYDMALRNFRAGKAGTAFGGRNEVGLAVEDLLARETSF
ncbi:MAG: PstS family phosphate ABC transporter substrate-binding protein [Steroidobacteraceae bacterium]